jgi:tellurite methyltransferase
MKNKEFWNNYYQSPEGANIRSSESLRELLPCLKKGKVLDVACGTGWNSLLLAENGFEVEGLDFSEIAVQKVQQAFRDKGFTGEFKTAGLDFYLAPLQRYDSIVIVDIRPHNRLLDEFKKGLVIGGTLYMENYTYNFLKKNPSSIIDTEDCYKPFELGNLLKGWNILYYDERDRDKDKVRAVLQKPGY